jgi:hypothetical protein
MKYLLMGLIKIYRVLISPILPSACRFYPTCSEYFYDSLKIHGFFKGSFLGIKRILKCNPFFEGGVDHVPPRVNLKK